MLASLRERRETSVSDEFVRADFEKIYDVYLDNLERKASLFKLLITFVIAPYLVAVALLSAEALKFGAIDDLRNLPGFLDFVIVIAGAGLLLPLFQYIEYDDNVMRTARSINHFRALYVQQMGGSSTWRPNLPTSSAYPLERRLGASGSILVIVFMCISVVYVVKGLSGLAGWDPLNPLLLALGAATFAALVWWYLRTGHNPLYGETHPRSARTTWIVAANVGNAWTSYLEHVCQHGRPTPDDRGQIFEAPAVAVTVEHFDSDDAIVRQHGDEKIRELYVRKMFSHEVVPELGTTYGDRLFNYDGCDQIATALKKLETNSWTKSATLTLLDPLERWPDRRMPCLTVVDLKVRDSQLALFAFFRSQNALNAYGNMYGLRAIQTHCAKHLGVEEGALTLFVSSPHVYERDLESARRIVGACQGGAEQ